MGRRPARRRTDRPRPPGHPVRPARLQDQGTAGVPARRAAAARIDRQPLVRGEPRGVRLPARRGFRPAARPHRSGRGQRRRLGRPPDRPHPPRAVHARGADAVQPDRPPPVVRGHLGEPAVDGPARPELGRGGLQRHPDGPLPPPGGQGGLPALPRQGRRGEGAAPGRRGGDAGGPPAGHVRHHEERAGAALLGEAGGAAARRPRRGLRRVRQRAEGRPARQGVGPALPDPVAGAVRPGHDRGHGLRDAGGGVAQRLGA
jgi:hypothetical protein